MIERSSFRDAATEPSLPSAPTTASGKRWQRISLPNILSKRILFRTGISLLTLGMITCAILYFLRPPANVDPFTPKVASSVQFSLYYPKVLPSGFRIDPKSVTAPSAGVIVFDLIGPKNEKIYISEEARPNKFDIGGFYKKFSNLKEIAISGGSVTTGKLYNGSVSMGAWLNNNVWILSNTNAPVPLPQIQTMLKSLVVNF